MKFTYCMEFYLVQLSMVISWIFQIVLESEYPAIGSSLDSDDR